MLIALPAAGQEAAQPKYRVSEAHLHFVDFLQNTDGIQALLAAMDRAGVDHAMLNGMPVVKKWDAADPRRPLYYLDDDSRAYWYSATDVLLARELERLPAAQRARLHPFICGFNATDRNAIDHVQRMYEWYPGLWEGIGEVFTRHDDLTALTYGEQARADHVALDAVYEFAAEHDLPVSIHSNVSSVWIREPLYLPELERAVQRHPATRFIWAHAGVSRRVEVPTLVDELRRLLAAYPNLYVDLSWVVLPQCIAPDGKIAPEWVALIEQFPARFMIGTDKIGHFGDYVDSIGAYYVLLDALRPATARGVARDNFIAILPQRVRERINSNAGN